MNFITTGHLSLIGIIAIMAIYICILLRRKNQAVPPENSPRISDEKYRDLFENANDAIFILDKDQNYIDVNRKAVELFKYSREEFLQLNVRDVIPPSQTSSSDKEFKRLRKDGQYEKFIGKQKTKDGRWLDIEVNSSTILSNGKVVGSRDIVRDITDRKKVEKEKESLILELQKALDEIKTLKGILPICSFCHKIRDDKGYWERVDVFISTHSNADVSHGICPECLAKHYPEHE